jgi:hypothetical protein
MLEAVLCILIIGGFFVFRAILATVFFFYLLPEGDRCPNCDAATLRVQSRGWNVLLQCFARAGATSAVGTGLRSGPLTPTPTSPADKAQALSVILMRPDASEASGGCHPDASPTSLRSSG